MISRVDIRDFAAIAAALVIYHAVERPVSDEDFADLDCALRIMEDE